MAEKIMKGGHTLNPRRPYRITRNGAQSGLLVTVHLDSGFKLGDMVLETLLPNGDLLIHRAPPGIEAPARKATKAQKRA